MPLLVISLLALLSIGQAGAEPLQVDDPLNRESTPRPYFISRQAGILGRRLARLAGSPLARIKRARGTAAASHGRLGHPERRNRTALNPAMLRVADQYLWKAARETLRFPGATTDHPALP